MESILYPPSPSHSEKPFVQTATSSLHFTPHVTLQVQYYQNTLSILGNRTSKPNHSTRHANTLPTESLYSSPDRTNFTFTMEFQINRIHQKEQDLPTGGNWVVQKFGGTSVGKFAVGIAQDIVL